MNLDRTFCSGLRCFKTATCARYRGRVDEYMKLHPEREYRMLRLSIAQYADHAGVCTKFEPMEETNDGSEAGKRTTEAGPV